MFEPAQTWWLRGLSAHRSSAIVKNRLSDADYEMLTCTTCPYRFTLPV